jgi:uncharacterized protein YprB with RNaseH-like and TPR domain
MLQDGFPRMLRHTFIHADGVGATTERRLWEQGVHTWDVFLELHRGNRVPLRRLCRLAPLVEESRSALLCRDLRFFSQRLSAAEQWRLYRDFADQAAYVDIETTGLSADRDAITVVGAYGSGSFRAFVRGKDLADFPAFVARYPLLVTFNGATFDLPFLRRAFPGFQPEAHLDLRYPLRRLGYTGGLKQIENRLGVIRPAHVREVDGFEAIRLWHEYRRGNRGALDLLVEYCRHDVTNLEPLAARAAQELFAQTGLPRT